MRFAIRPRIRRAFRLALRRRDLADREVDEELRMHVALRISQLMARGLTRDEAERQTYQRLGGSWEETVDRLQRAGRTRDDRLRVQEWLDAVRADLAYAVRTAARQPGFAIVVVLTFALGIGANATMFGVIDRLLLRPPPHVREAGELLEVARILQRDGRTRYHTGMQYPLYAQLRNDSAVFRDVAATSFITTQSLGSGPSAEQARVVFATGNYFRVVGTEPALGRLFGTAEDGEVPSSDVAILSHGFWLRRFAGDPAIVGKTIEVGLRDFTVIGVAQPGFTGVDPLRVDLWLPIAHAQFFGMAGGAWASSWGNVWLRVLARLQPGVSPAAAATRARTWYTTGLASWTSGRSKGAIPELDAPIGLRSILPSARLADDSQANLARLLFGVTAVVLLIACANVASLLLARGTERRREIAVRLALGVSRRRLLRLLFAETTVLALCGGVIALVVAQWGIALLQATLLSDFAWTESAFDGRVLAATFALVIATVALAGIAPALRASRPEVVESLKAGGRAGGVAVSRVRTALMTVQATLSVILIVGAGLFVRSLRQAASFRLGYETTGALAATMDVIPLGYTLPARVALFESMRDRVAALPGVAGVAVATTYPMQGFGYGIRVRVPGRDSLPAPANGMLFYNAVGATFFSTLGIPIVEGRPILATDVAVASRVAVLSEAMARAYWPGERAVDRCIILNVDSVCTTVVGVAADAKEGLRPADPRFLVYVPAGPAWRAGPNVLVIRSNDGNADRLVTPIRRAMQGTEPNLPYADVQTFDAVLAPEIRPWRTGATLFSLFGGLALLIAAIGLYSAISYGVVQRRHEFGVRMALGAQIADVMQLVLGQGVRATGVGVAVGLLAAFWAGQFVREMLFDTSPRNPIVFVVVAVGMLLVAVTATMVPAWRASRVDPASALRSD